MILSVREVQRNTNNPYTIAVGDTLTGDRSIDYYFGAEPTFALTVGVSDGDATTAEHAEDGHPEDDLAVAAGCDYSVSPAPDLSGVFRNDTRQHLAYGTSGVDVHCDALYQRCV